MVIKGIRIDAHLIGDMSADILEIVDKLEMELIKRDLNFEQRNSAKKSSKLQENFGKWVRQVPQLKNSRLSFNQRLVDGISTCDIFIPD